MIDLARERDSIHRNTWETLYSVAKTLRHDGMSDEESDVDDDGRRVKRVGIVKCRRRMVQELTTIDKVRETHPEFFVHARARVPQVRSGDRKITGQNGFTGRPQSFYEQSWLNSLPSWTRASLKVKDGDNFPWPDLKALQNAHEL